MYLHKTSHLPITVAPEGVGGFFSLRALGEGAHRIGVWGVLIWRVRMLRHFWFDSVTGFWGVGQDLGI